MAEDHLKGHVSEEEAREVAEAAREEKWENPSFMKELFMGNFRLDLIHPLPEETPEQRAAGDAYIEKLSAYLRENVDGDEVDRDKEVPKEVLDGLSALGAFGIKIPKEYGGLGLSQTSYSRAVEMVTSRCGSTAAWLSAHQSIGVPQPLKLFGSEEQKKKYFPRLARGAVSAFALTEPEVGSDPANMATTAVPVEGGKYFEITGEKLWITNGAAADLLVVMARTPSKTVRGREVKQITAFIVEKDMPGFEVVHRCRFMGMNGMQNGLLRFDKVRVPRENILWGEGLGLKLALITLNTGRLTLPASCVGTSKRCIEILRAWANERIQWGAAIGKHEAVAAKIADMTSMTFAMESVGAMTCGMVDKGGFDIRLEAAAAKMHQTEATWHILHETLQTRGGRGYETADSLKARGEKPVPVERMVRDFRVNTILEGSTEIMHLFLAREAVDAHFQLAGVLLDPRAPIMAKLKGLAKAAAFYAGWYPTRWLAGLRSLRSYGEFGPLAGHVRYVDRTAGRLARGVFHCMMVHQAKLEKRQLLLARLVDVGTELMTMAATCANAQAMRKRGENGEKAVELADHFCRGARRRIDALFRALWRNEDVRSYKLALRVLADEHVWLEDGIATPAPAKAAKPAETPRVAVGGSR
ncbi:MAG: acyl-CoA dehydrogenase family protein [Myxococcota bacterium]